MSVYILQKDLPDGAVKGDRYIKKQNSDTYRNERLDNSRSPVIEHNSYFKWQVENNPEWFKKEEPKQLEWEILEIECYGGKIRKLIDGQYRLYVDGIGFEADYLLSKSDSKIKSVRRLRDNEVFSIGDSIEFGSMSMNKNSVAELRTGEIERFSFNVNNKLMAFGNEHTNNCFGLFIPMLSKQKSKPEQPLPIKGSNPIIRDLSSYDIHEELEKINKKWKGVTEFLKSESKMYTSDELLEAQQKAFYAGKEMVWGNEKSGFPKYSEKYTTFTSYIESLNK